MTIVAALALAAGTFAFRWAGPALRNRISFPDRAVRLLEIGAVVLLAAVAAVTALPFTAGHVDLALPAGVLVAGLLAWRSAPLPVVILAAAGTTALLRLFGAG
ncbi:AzlD domain-containing protein [Nocardia takedensis]|uniref:AzlD domain-containing protein n=1 Tax=Nocardia takedensis TaxID=259390 RepID=UPI000306C272|nr:AzlD domain-containing protein [Nocardia takedensis]